MAFIVTFHPQRSSAHLSLEKDGETLIINGQRFDFSELEEGATLPHSAIQSDFIVGPVNREKGHIALQVILPHGTDVPDSVLYPKKQGYSSDGPMALPTDAGRPV